MASDDKLYDTTPITPADEMVESTDEVVTDTPTTEQGTDGFPNRWAGGPDDTGASGAEFGQTWSGGPDGSTEQAEEFGQAWSGVPADQPADADKFGATWSGDNQETPAT
ncbi:MAG: hypothetical protein ACOH16_14095 [Propionibacteriaceae bacterium]